MSFHKTGGIRIAGRRDLMAQHARSAGKARYLRMPFELVGPDQIKALFPYLETDGLLGGVHTPDDGHIDPSSLTNAYAGGARAAGAEIHRHTRVTALARTPGGEWRVETSGGTISAEHVVNAGGLWLREVAALVGHAPPAAALERQYLVTEDVPGIEEMGRELPVLRDPGTPLYLSQEQRGLLLGLYDLEPRLWATEGTPAEFDQELLPMDLDRVSHAFERQVARVPVLGQVGVKTVINGPLITTPDGNPLMGPVRGIPNFWMHCGALAGITLAGSCSRHLARWMVDGEPDMDVSTLDARRFGDWADADYAMAGTLATFAHYSSSFAYPHEETPREKPARASALHGRLQDRRAVFGARAGWEAPNWFAPAGAEAADRPSFRRANWFAAVGAECRAVRAGAGLLDFSSIAKYEVTGRGAAAFLDRLSANRLPDRPGGMAVAPMLTERGRLAALLVIAHPGPERYYLTGAGAAELQALDWLERHRPADGAVAIRNMSEDMGALLLAGARAREALARASDTDLSDEAFPPVTARAFEIGATQVLGLRLSAVGGPGWEIHCPMGDLGAVYDALFAGAGELGVTDFGWRAFDSLRLEVGRPRWGRDCGPSADPQAAGLARYLAPDKPDFLGRAALLARQGQPSGERLACLALVADDDPKGIDVAGAEPVMLGEDCVGLVTSGGYGHTVGMGLALASLRADLAEPGTELEVEILAERHPVRVIDPPLAG